MFWSSHHQDENNDVKMYVYDINNSRPNITHLYTVLNYKFPLKMENTV